MVRDCAPDDIGVSVSYPLPGTTFYQRVQAQLGQKQNWVDSNDLAMMYHATYVPDFYRALHALVHAEFRAGKSTALVARGAAGRGRAAGATRAPPQMPPYQSVEGGGAAAPPQPAGAADARPRRRRRSIPLLTPQAAAVPTDQSSLK